MNFELIEEIKPRLAQGGTLYTLKFEDQTDTELDRFLQDGEVHTHGSQLRRLTYKLDRLAAEQGFPRNRFDHYFNIRVAGRDVPLCRLKETNVLRLYFLYYGKVVIAGCGGVKPPGIRTFQDVPKLNEAVERLKLAFIRIDERMRIDRDLLFDPMSENKLVGNFVFE